MSERLSTERERTPELRFARLAPDVWQALSDLKRTGWVRKGIANPESVQEHTISLRELAVSFVGLSTEEKEGLLDMLEVHDWPEAIHGDEVLLSTGAKESQAALATKFEKEKAALVSICDKLGEAGEEIMALWLRFEESHDPSASLARELDKYQAVEKALEYEKQQGVACFKEFLDYSRKFITHPVLVLRIEKLEAEWSDLPKI